MGTLVEIAAADGHRLDAYLAGPERPRGGIVVVQEIFGVNSHIRSVTDRYAAQGYQTIAPALFDRIERKVDLTYQGADYEKALSLRRALAFDVALLDVAAGVQRLKSGGAGKVGVVGYCYGGTLAWLSAARVEGLSAAVGYYGGGIGNFAGEESKCPVQLHFGELDNHIPMAEVEKMRGAKPTPEIYVYAGVGHGFNCDERGSYNADAARLAEERALAHFAKALG
jgi:carboxymethylenebutenolidase